MSVHEIRTSQQDVREPFASVGLVCTCGNAVSGWEGTVVRCAGCGTAYIISVMVIRAGMVVSAAGDPE